MNQFLFLCIIFGIIYSSEGQIAKCDYSHKFFSISGYKTANSSNYRCDLSTKQANYDEKLTRIDGQHLTEHSDADVKLIVNYKYNKLKTFYSIFCQKFPNLELISLDNAELESIDENSLLNCKNLDKLFLVGNKIRELPENLLNRNLKLTHIWIHKNQLITLPENLFLNQNELFDLYLHENQITSLSSNIFHPLVKLEVLYLDNNKLQSINPQWLVTLQNLRWLALNGNQISEIPSKCFASLGNLEKLFLYENRIQALNSDSFDGLQNLQILNLQDNEISDLPVSVFAQLRNLEQLTLSNNKLTTIHSDSFAILHQLNEVYLEDNTINAIDPNFIDNTAVSILNMTNNICSQLLTETKSEIKPNLKKCFDNYQPRPTQLQQQVGLRFTPFSNQSILTSQNICGKISTGQGNIVGGAQISRRSFPWLAALFKKSGEFFCGGTLLSSRKVLTAAHCIQDKHTNKATTAGEIIVLLGAYDLNKTIEIGRIPYAVETVNVHPDWNTLSEPYDYDIAVLVVDTAVTFSKFIQPICMPNSAIESIKTGIVVGFGKSEDTTKIHENIPRMIETPIHKNEDCFFKYNDLLRLSSKRTFCAGTGTSIGVCNGDSGSGLIVNDGSAFYIRGIVSSSLISGPYGCDLNAYSVFTDVTKYIEWINGVSTDRFN